MRIPRDLVAAIIQDWCDRYDAEHSRPKVRGASYQLESRAALSLYSGVDRRSIDTILEGKITGGRERKKLPYLTISFDKVDKIFTKGMSSPHIWHEHPELAKIYESGIDQLEFAS